MTQPVERESMEVDVLYVGGGPATLASALHLMNQIEEAARPSSRPQCS
jgi:flavin-dependent dehydrogenase